jgi:hypothetical protein
LRVPSNAGPGEVPAPINRALAGTLPDAHEGDVHVYRFTVKVIC